MLTSKKTAKIYGFSALTLYISCLVLLILDHNDILKGINTLTLPLSRFLFECCSIAFISCAIWYSLFQNGKANIKETWNKNKFVTFALFFCFVAESMKLFPVIETFALGAFFLTHIFFILECFKIRKFKPFDLYILAIFIVISIAFYLSMMNKLNSNDNIGGGGIIGLLYKIAIPLYICLLGISCWRAILLYNSTLSVPLLIGVLIFYISDLIVVSGLTADIPELSYDTVVWVTYLPAIFFVSITNVDFLKELKSNW